MLSYIHVDNLSITTGSGTLIIGKDSLRTYVQKLFDTYEDLFFVRKTKRLSFHKNGGRVWEEGGWTGFRPDTPDWQQPKGKYAAMWVKVEGVWKIRSELFVTLE